jgi:hypothetical protein
MFTQPTENPIHYCNEKKLQALAAKYKWGQSDPSGTQSLFKNIYVRLRQSELVDMSVFDRTVVTIKNNPITINYGPTASWANFYLYSAEDPNHHSNVRQYTSLEEALGFWCNRIISLEFTSLDTSLRKEIYAMTPNGYDRFKILFKNPKYREMCSGISGFDVIIRRFIEQYEAAPNSHFWVWNVGGAIQYNLTCVRNKS